jgi:lipopolysaccharide transport system ATP-binding protein
MSSELPSSGWAIRAQGLGKTYRLYDKPHHRLLQSLWRGRKSYFREFAALSDVSFELARGQTLGIIGRNGAGKSTLLQIICGTLTPSAGQVEVNGRIAALLELGTGFNPDFTGRENIVINAAILGLSQREIADRLDDIIAFADIGPFIDQPVKTYSSGMYVRLAFAVVVHVNPDILIVDEALAVGDALFQAKCMTRMRRMLDDGLTLLFTSHDVAAVKALCKTALWLEHGQVRGFGDTVQVTRDYGHDWVAQANLAQNAVAVVPPMEAVDAKDSEIIVDIPARFTSRIGTGAATLSDIKWHIDGEAATEPLADYGDILVIHARLNVHQTCNQLAVAFHIKNRQNLHVMGGHTADDLNMRKRVWQPGDIADITFRLPVWLHEGAYSLTMLVSTLQDVYRYTDAVFLDWVEDASILKVVPRDRYPLTDMVEVAPEVRVVVL